MYSTEFGRICPKCQKNLKKCICKQNINPFPNDGVVRLKRQTKGRKGKGVTLVSGVPLASPELVKLGKLLKKKCGSGGTVKNGVIEIQGDQRDILMVELSKKGWTVKCVGG